MQTEPLYTATGDDPYAQLGTPAPLAIFGAGGFGREVAWMLELLAEHGPYAPFVAAAFLDDGPPQGPVAGLDVTTPARYAAAHPGGAVVVAVGDPGARAGIVARLDALGLRAATLVARGVPPPARTAIGEGSIICAGSVLTCDVTLGRHVHVNLNCTVGHGARLGDFVTLSPGAHISGEARVGERVLVGTGAVVIPGMRIGAGATVGAGAVVTRDVPAGETWVGVPARPKGR